MCDSDCSVSSDYEDEFSTKVESPISVSSEFEESGTKVADLPERSRSAYELAYERFEKWCEERHMKNESSENTLLAYFEDKSRTQKPTSLWVNYSMLRTVLASKQNVDISIHRRLNAFLKRKSAGYQAKKSKILSKKEVAKFLQEADDSKFLLIKVVLIFGLVASCGREDLTNLLAENVQDEGEFFRVIIPDARTKIPLEYFITSGDIEGLNMVHIVRKYVALRPAAIAHGRFFIAYRNGTCTRQPIGKNTFGTMPKTVASFLKLANPEEYTGHCFKKLSSSFKH